MREIGKFFFCGHLVFLYRDLKCCGEVDWIQISVCFQHLSDGDYEEWLEQHRQAETALHDRERLLHQSAHKLECKMELVGATGIEDRLQDGVPETIARLREGGLKVWVLTGDKQVEI